MKHQTTAHTRSDSTALVAVAAVSVQFVTNSLINQLNPHFLQIITSSNRHTAELRSCFVVCSLGPKLGRSTLLICELAAQTVVLTPHAANPRLRLRAVHRAVRQVRSVLLLACRALVVRLRARRWPTFGELSRRGWVVAWLDMLISLEVSRCSCRVHMPASRPDNATLVTLNCALTIPPR